jgi:pyruvate,orthophosphate dikinase
VTAGSRDHLHFVLPGVPAAAEASAETLGCKAYSLLRLARLGLPVPPAFVLDTALCRQYFERGGRLPDDLPEVLAHGLARLEATTGRAFGSPRRPLLVSVRSGAPVSMPGMMQTILNVGLGEKTVRGLIRLTGNPRQARDCYRRLIRDFAKVVRGAAAHPFDALIDRERLKDGLAAARELDSAALGRIVQESLDLTLALTGEPFPQDPLAQLLGAVEAVLRSWDSEKARTYRRLNGINDSSGTAITVQAMVFGNAGADSGAGVGFTRDPATGENHPVLDFLFNVQGEDVVSGRHTVHDTALLPLRLPAVAAELGRIATVLEDEFRDMQDFEFTVENGRLCLLQTRDGKRTPWAALRIAVDLVHAERISPAEALERLEGLALDRLERVRIAAGAETTPLATAVPASVGVATGEIVFDPKRAVERRNHGRDVILMRQDIATDDIEGLVAAEGVLTAAGGRTSHAAVVARQFGKVCLVGCDALRIDATLRGCVLGQERLEEGDTVTLDANSGRVYAGRLPLVHERPEADLAELAGWRRERESIVSQD